MKNLILLRLSGILTAAMLLHCLVLPAIAHADSFTTGPAVLNVPYTSQVPLGEWSDARQRDGCEEASIVMALMWAKGISFSPAEVRQQITGMSDFEQYFYGYYRDTSAQDTANLMVSYFGYPHVAVRYNISTEDIKAALDYGELVIVPLNPRVISTTLYNPATTHHTVVVVGYDSAAREIIFHDPLVAGAYARAPEASFNAALADYPSGNHKTAAVHSTAMVLVSR